MSPPVSTTTSGHCTAPSHCTTLCNQSVNSDACHAQTAVRHTSRRLNATAMSIQDAVSKLRHCNDGGATDGHHYHVHSAACRHFLWLDADSNHNTHRAPEDPAAAADAASRQPWLCRAHSPAEASHTARRRIWCAPGHLCLTSADNPKVPQQWRRQRSDTSTVKEHQGYQTGSYLCKLVLSSAKLQSRGKHQVGLDWRTMQ